MPNKVFQVAFEIAGKMGASFQSTFSSASAQMRTLGAQSVALRSNLKTLDAAYKSGVISLDSYKNAQARLKAQLEQTQSTQSRLMAAQSRQNEAARRAGQIRGAMVDTAAMAAPLVMATGAAIDFETAMNGVAKQVQGARDDNGELTATYYEMQTNVMSLSRELHMLPDVVANTTAAAARMGVQGTDALNDFVRMSVQMGVAFEGSGDQIAEQMAKIANIRGIKIDTAEGRAQINDLADTVNYLDDQTTAKGPEIIEVLQRISGTAAQSSFSNNELASLATTMLDLGKTPEVAATGLNALMNRIATAPSQAKPFQETLAQLGINAKQLQESYMSDSRGTLFGLLDQIKGLDKAQQAEVLTGLFGAEYQDDISALAAGIDKLRGNMDLLNDSARQGSMEREFAAKMKTTQAAIDGVKQSAAETGISLTQTLLPSVQMIAGGFQAGAQMLANFSQQYPMLTQAIVMTTVGLVGFRIAWLAASFMINQYRSQKAALLVLQQRHYAQMAINRTALLLNTGATRTAATAQWAWNAALTANPIGLVIVSIAALIAAGYLLYQNWDTVSSFVSSAWQTACNGVAYGIGFLIGYIPTLPAKVGAMVTESGVWLMNLPTLCATAGDEFVAAAEGWASQAYESVKSWISQIPSMISNFVSNSWANAKASFTVGLAAGGGQVASNAAGGIYSRGAFLTTFAENSDEAAIPLDGSARAVSLWEKAGDMLGMNRGGNTFKLTFAPVIHGSDRQTMEAVQRQQDSFFEQAKGFAHQQERVSYGT